MRIPPRFTAWYGQLGADGRRAFWVAFAGFAFSGFDLLGLTFVVEPIRVEFGLTEAQVGLLATAALLAGAVGGVAGGIVADRAGRVPAVVAATAVYAVATLACGLAQGYEQLLVFRILLGLGFGGAWTASTLIVAEYAPAASRGTVLGVATSGFVVGDLLAALAAAVLAQIGGPELEWRVLFWLGILPALPLVWVRLGLREPPIARTAQTAPGAPRPSVASLFAGPMRATTIAAIALSAGALSGNYVVIVWIPTLLRTVDGLAPAAVSVTMLPFLAGSWLGFVVGGLIHDLLGHRRSFAIFSLLSAGSIGLYVLDPAGDAALIPIGLLLGFATAGTITGLGPYLTELYPGAIRGLGQGLTYSVGRGISAIPATVVGGLATGVGLAEAIGGSALVYLLCLAALLVLPETQGKALD